MLSKEEYVEQAYFFSVLLERLEQNVPLQDLLAQLKFELLATTKLPMAIDLLLSELKHRGMMNPGMRLLKHYFVPFQTFLITEAESDTGRFQYQIAVQILAAEASFRAEEDKLSPQGLFFYQFEALSRNRLNYDRGLLAMSEDPIFDDDWRDWILKLRADLGMVDLADLIFIRSEFFEQRRKQAGDRNEGERPLFGLAEGRIAYANRQKEPLFLFAAMQRHLGYPAVPRPEPPDPLPELVPQLLRRVERLESRIKLLEEEQQGGIDITKFYHGGQIPEAGDSLFGDDS